MPLRKHLSLFFKMIEHYASNNGYSIGIEFLNEKQDNFLQSAIFFFAQEHVKARYAEIYLNFPVHLGKCKQFILVKTLGSSISSEG